MKKFNLKSYLAGVLTLALVLSIVLPTAATVAKRPLEASYNNIKITMNGKALTPTDASGNPVEPFTVDGTTYLPVRAVGNALGLGVDWDGATQTVLLTGNQNADSTEDVSTIQELLIYHSLYSLADDQKVLLDTLDTLFITDTSDPVYQKLLGYCDTGFQEAHDSALALLDYCNTDEELTLMQQCVDIETKLVETKTALLNHKRAGTNATRDAYGRAYTATTQMITNTKVAINNAFSAAVTG